MYYILIVVLLRSNTITMQEFASKQACEAAIVTLQELYVNHGNYNAKCVQK